MNILVFAGSFYPFSGGYENFIYNLSIKLIEKGHIISILTMNTEHSAPFEKLDGIKVHRIPCWNALNRTFPIPKPSIKSLRIFHMLYKNDCDLINTHTRFFITSFIGTIFAKIKHIPHIHIEHGSTHSVLTNKFVSLVNVVYDHSIGWLIVKLANKNVGISSSSCDFLKHIGDNRPNLILDGIDIDVFKKVDTDLKDRMGLKNNFIIVFIGRLVYAKGAQDLIKIFPRIKNKRQNIKALLVGDGPYRNELEGMIPDEFKDDILFLGTKTQQEISEILNMADIFVNLSYSEGFGITVLEAGAVGVPVVATKVGGVPELIKDYETGISIKPGDYDHLYKAIVELMDDSSLREKMGNNIAIEIKTNYGWDTTVNKYERLFERSIV